MTVVRPSDRAVAWHEAHHAAGMLLGGVTPTCARVDWPAAGLLGSVRFEWSGGEPNEVEARHLLVAVLLGALTDGSDGWDRWPLEPDRIPEGARRDAETAAVLAKFIGVEDRARRLKSRDARRELPLSPGMADRLRELRRDSYRGEGAPVFASAVGTELSRPNVATRVLKPAAEAAGLVALGNDGEPKAWVSFHTFRHTCASLLFAEGRNVKQVAEWLGHSDPAFTLRTYVHLMDEGLGGADFFDEVVETAQAELSSLAV
jgi:Phage integrase family